jgi:hypothetical protein
MDYIVYPLAITTPSWPTFIEACQASFGFSPTRILDDSNIPLNSSQAFTESLKSIFGDDRRVLNHSFISFLAILDDDMLIYCYDWLSPLDINYKSFDRQRLVIISGSAGMWIRKIVDGCTTGTPKQFRIFLNTICGHLSTAGFRKYFDACHETTLPDGTTIFRK